MVFGAHPGHVRSELALDLPRPRARGEADVQVFVDRLYGLMTRPETAEEIQRVTPARPPLTLLPHARVGALAGLVELVAEREGRADLHRLAADLQFEVDDLLPVVDGAVLLGMARVEEGEVVLESAGEAFAAAPILARKELFRHMLLERPTLVTRIHSALTAKQNHRLPEAFFLDPLEDHLSAQEARRQRLFLETAEPRPVGNPSGRPSTA